MTKEQQSFLDELSSYLRGVASQLEQTARNRADIPGDDNARQAATVRGFERRLRELLIDVAEPSFTVWAHDEFAQATVRFWIDRAIVAGVPEPKIAKAIERHQEIIAYQSDHPEKVRRPD